MSSRLRILLLCTLVFGICLGIFWAGWAWREWTVERGAGEPAGSCFLYYTISGSSLRVQTTGGGTHSFADVASGDNLVASIGIENTGPIPPGAYLVYTRDQGRPTFAGRPAFLLDPLDRRPGNDRIDGFPPAVGGGRSAFRIHADTGTDGCLATDQIEEIASILLPHGSARRFDIYSRPATSGRPGMKRFRQTDPGVWEPAPHDGDWELFEQEQRIGLLWVTP